MLHVGESDEDPVAAQSHAQAGCNIPGQLEASHREGVVGIVGHNLAEARLGIDRGIDRP